MAVKESDAEALVVAVVGLLLLVRDVGSMGFELVGIRGDSKEGVVVFTSGLVDISAVVEGLEGVIDRASSFGLSVFDSVVFNGVGFNLSHSAYVDG